AASRIQAAYVGYRLRCHWVAVRHSLVVRKSMRSIMREALQDTGLVLTKRDYLNRKKHQRAEAAAVLQRSFRVYLAVRGVKARQRAAEWLATQDAVRRIQQWALHCVAVRCLDYHRKRAEVERKEHAVTLLQALHRRRMAGRLVRQRRRVFHDVCATMVQSSYRIYCAQKLLQQKQHQRTRAGAVHMQRIIRGFMARRMVARKRHVAWKRRMMTALARLHRFFRGACACRKVKRVRERVRRRIRVTAAIHLQRVGRGCIGRRCAHQIRQAVKKDIWWQARAGAADLVDGLYYGQGVGGRMFDRNSRNDRGELLLAVAARVGSMAVVRKLLQFQFSYDAVLVGSGASPLEQAIVYQHHDIASLLFAKMITPPKEGEKAPLHVPLAPWQLTALMQLTTPAGMHSLTMLMLKAGPHSLTMEPICAENLREDDSGSTMLHAACEHGFPELLWLFTSQPSCPDVDQVNPVGQTAMHVAARAGREKCIEHLLESGAQPIVRDPAGQTPYAAALLRGHEEAAAVLKAASKAKLKDKSLRSPSDADVGLLMQAAEKGQTNVVTQLMAAGMSWDVCHSPTGDTLCTAAARGGSVAMLQLCLENGVGAGAHDKDKRTALHYATLCKDGAESLNLLLTSPASELTKESLMQQDRWGCTPMHYICRGRVDLLQDIPCLQNAHMDCEYHELSKGESPLHTAAATQFLPHLQLLLGLGASINARSFSGSTPLHRLVEAASGPNPLPEGELRQVMRLMLDAGADVLVADGAGESAVMKAVRLGCSVAVEEMRSLLELPELASLSFHALAVPRGPPQCLCLRALAKGCADSEVIKWRDTNGDSLLERAMQLGNREAIQHILTMAMNCMQQVLNSRGDKVLHIVARWGSYQDMSALVREDNFKLALLEEVNAAGHSPLVIALLSNNHEVALQLVRMGVNITQASHGVRQAWLVAASIGRGALCPCTSCCYGRSRAFMEAACCESTWAPDGADGFFKGLRMVASAKRQLMTKNA
ncbi:unnamed protein product, partial [Chrysoparadoxa australica]